LSRATACNKDVQTRLVPSLQLGNEVTSLRVKYNGVLKTKQGEADAGAKRVGLLPPIDPMLGMNRHSAVNIVES
jgi:hypothetical protein